MINDTAVIIGDRHTRAMIFFSLPFAVEFPSLREDFKFCHTLYPAREYPTHIKISQIRRTIYEIKYQNFLSAYKTSKLNVSVTATYAKNDWPPTLHDVIFIFNIIFILYFNIVEETEF